MGDSRLHDCNGVPFVIAGPIPVELGRYLQLGGVSQQITDQYLSRNGSTNTSFGDPNVPAGTLQSSSSKEIPDESCDESKSTRAFVLGLASDAALKRARSPRA